MLYFFFFQAEDGIRDTSVTGVQTCALPISFDQIRRYADAFDGALAFSNCCGQSSVTVGRERWSADRFFVSGDFFSTLGLMRSEERRVGKEWRSRWSREH